MHRPVPEEHAAAAVAAAWEAGIRCFDTAPFYGAGTGERRLGGALAGRPRNEYAFSTKVGRLVVDGGVDYDFSRDGVLRSLEASRARTGLDRFDTVFVHDPEDHLDAALGTALPTLAELRGEGAIGAIGVGTNVVETARQFLARGDIDAIMLAGRWTLVDRSGSGVLDECERRRIAVLAAAPFNSGLLALPSPRDDARFNYGTAPPDVLAIARECAAICERHGVELPAAALQFPLRHAAVSAVVVGLCDTGEVTAAIERVSVDIPDELWTEIDALISTSGR